MRRLSLFAFVFSLNVWTQTTPSSLQVTRLYNIYSTPSTCSPYSNQCIDNRSSLRQNNYHSFYATGTGTWSATMEYADSASGPWSSFGAGAVVTDTSTYPVGFGFGYHAFVRFNISGSVAVTYSGTKDFFPGGTGDGGSGASGILLLNSLSGSSQTLVAGTSGTNFAISSTGTTHTFNIPTAGAAITRGLLSGSDWSTFNAKAGAGSCSAGSYANSVTSTGPACAQVQYSQIGSTPTLYHQGIQVNGVAQTPRTNINLISGTNVTLSPADDAGNNKIDLTISATAGSGGYVTVQEEASDLTERAKINFVGGALTAADNAGQSRTDVTLSQSPVGSTSVVGTGRTVSTTSPITGGGDLSADRTLACPTCVVSAASLTSGKVVVGAGSQGVLVSSKNLPTGDLVGTTDTQTLEAKSLTSPTITNATINQAANGNVAISGKRTTDTAPTGDFMNFQNQAGTADLWRVDVSGTLQSGIVPGARVSGNISGNAATATSATTASTATALAANGTNCSTGQAAAGVDASGNAEGCFTPSGGSGGGLKVCEPSSGSGTTYTCTVTDATYAKGLTLQFYPDVTNTGAATVNVSTQGPKTIQRRDGNAVVSGELVAGDGYLITYNGTVFELTETPVAIDSTLTGALSLERSGSQVKIKKEAELCLNADACAPTGARDFSGSAKTAPFRIGTSDPGTCDATAREFFFNTTSNLVKVCNTTNTWTAINSDSTQQITILHQTVNAAEVTGDGSHKTLVSYSMPAGSVQAGDSLEIEAFIYRPGTFADATSFGIELGNGVIINCCHGSVTRAYLIHAVWAVEDSTTIHGYAWLGNSGIAGVEVENEYAYTQPTNFDASSTTTIALKTKGTAMGETDKARVVYFRVIRKRV